MNCNLLRLVILFSFVVIRRLIISFKIARNAKTINFFLFTPTIIDETNKKYLLVSSIAIAILFLFMFISATLFKSNLFFYFGLIVYCILLYKADEYTK